MFSWFRGLVVADVKVRGHSGPISDPRSEEAKLQEILVSHGSSHGGDNRGPLSASCSQRSPAVVGMFQATIVGPFLIGSWNHSPSGISASFEFEVPAILPSLPWFFPCRTVKALVPRDRVPSTRNANGSFDHLRDRQHCAAAAVSCQQQLKKHPSPTRGPREATATP